MLSKLREGGRAAGLQKEREELFEARIEAWIK